MTQTEALKLARGILCAPYHDVPLDDVLEAIDKALAQTEQEPVAIHQFRSPHCADWYDGIPDHHDGHGPYEVRTLYTTPPQRKEPEQEPVAWFRNEDIFGNQEMEPIFYATKAWDNCQPLYTTPPQRKPLTDDQREKIAANVAGGGVNWTLGNVIDAVEAAHDIKE